MHHSLDHLAVCHTLLNFQTQTGTRTSLPCKTHTPAQPSASPYLLSSLHFSPQQPAHAWNRKPLRVISLPAPYSPPGGRGGRISSPAFLKRHRAGLRGAPHGHPLCRPVPVKERGRSQGRSLLRGSIPPRDPHLGSPQPHSRPGAPAAGSEPPQRPPNAAAGLSQAEPCDHPTAPHSPPGPPPLSSATPANVGG